MRRKSIVIIITCILLLLTVAGLAYRYTDSIEKASKEAIQQNESDNEKGKAKKKLSQKKKTKEETKPKASVPKNTEKKDVAPEELGDDTTEQQATKQEDTESEAQSSEISASIPTADSTGYDGKYRIDVNRAANTVTVYERDKKGAFTVPVKAMVCSTGPVTPLGDYYLPGRKQEIGLLFGDVYGMYATDIVGHILFHSVPARDADPNTIIGEEYNKLGTSASAGCVRLTVPDARWIQENAATGTWVHIYDNANNPGPLGKPTPMRMDVAYGPDPSLN